MFFFFFFKQKTAYDMRISDWSSDVCSSDLDLGLEDVRGAEIQATAVEHAKDPVRRIQVGGGNGHQIAARRDELHQPHQRRFIQLRQGIDEQVRIGTQPGLAVGQRVVQRHQLLDATFVLHRSEEHTSELQSLMRISYAVFCLKKKKNQYTNTTKQSRK